VAGRTTYRLAAFGGHGMNSYAIYLTDVRPGLSLRLRLSFGGVYGDAERDSAAVVTTVQRLYALVDAVGARLAHFELESDMERHRARLRSTAENGKDGSITSRIWKASRERWQKAACPPHAIGQETAVTGPT